VAVPVVPVDSCFFFRGFRGDAEDMACIGNGTTIPVSVRSHTPEEYALVSSAPKVTIIGSYILLENLLIPTLGGLVGYGTRL